MNLNLYDTIQRSSKFTPLQVKTIYYHILDEMALGWSQQMKNDIIHVLCGEWFYNHFHSHETPPFLYCILPINENIERIIDELSEEFEVIKVLNWRYIFFKTEEDANYAKLRINGIRTNNLIQITQLEKLYKKLDRQYANRREC